MDVEIVKQNDVPLLSRKEITAKIYFEGVTPSRFDVRKALASKINGNESLLVIKKIDTAFGHNYAKIYAYFYNNEDALKKMEDKYMFLRHMTKEQRAEEKKKIQEEKSKKAASSGKKESRQKKA